MASTKLLEQNLRQLYAQADYLNKPVYHDRILRTDIPKRKASPAPTISRRIRGEMSLWCGRRPVKNEVESKDVRFEIRPECLPGPKYVGRDINLPQFDCVKGLVVF